MEELAKLVDGQKVILLDEGDAGWKVQFPGAEVGQVSLGSGLRIVVYANEGESLEVNIEGRLDVRGDRVGPKTIDPQEPTSGLGILAASLLHERLSLCEASRSGELHLLFNAGTGITVPPSPEIEAWSLDGSLFKLVSLPGGKVGYWDRRDPEREVRLIEGR